MQQTILGFSQIQLIEYNLTIIDAHLLRWFIDCIVGEPFIAEPLSKTPRYYPINYQSVIDELPSFNIHNPRVISRHFNALCKCGLLEKKIEKTGEGTSISFTYSNSKLKELLSIEEGEVLL